MTRYLEPLLYASATAGVALIVLVVVLACVWNSEPACHPRSYRRPDPKGPPCPPS